MLNSQRYLIVWTTAFACLMVCILVNPPSVSDGNLYQSIQDTHNQRESDWHNDTASATGDATALSHPIVIPSIGDYTPEGSLPSRPEYIKKTKEITDTVSLERVEANVNPARLDSEYLAEIRGVHLPISRDDRNANAANDGIPSAFEPERNHQIGVGSELQRAPGFNAPFHQSHSPSITSESAYVTEATLPQSGFSATAERALVLASQIREDRWGDERIRFVTEGIAIENELRLAQAQVTNSAGTEEDREAEKMGVPPPKQTPAFLRRQSILLEPGEYQVEYGVLYGVDASTIPIGTLTGENSDQLQIGNANQKRQQLLLPLEFRCGVWEDTQGFLSIPIGYSNSSLYLGASGNENDTLGIGDLGIGLTRVLWAPEKNNFRMLGFLQASAPTGSGGIAISSSQREVSLGAGYWTLTSGLNFTESYDPIVLFTSTGYTYTFAEKISSTVHIDAGNTVFYQGGLGYAINPTVTCSVVFAGATSGALLLNGAPLSGTRSELFTLRVACTITDPTNKRLSRLGRTHEPFMKFGLNQGANDVEFGIRWTY